MGRITTGVGLVSGINSKDIIDQLMALEERPKALLQKRVDSVNSQKVAYTDLQTRLTTMKLSATSLKKPSFFQGSQVTSSDEDVITATAGNGASVGSYQFQVARLVTAQQTVSKGFADFDSTKLGAGTITIEQGGGDLNQETGLGELNGGAGVRRGVFRVTDRSGASATIDITAAVSVDDVIKKINTSLGIQVKASVNGDGLVLTDLTGKTASDLIVQDVGESKAAADLGLVGTSAGTTAITGTDVNFLGRATNLSQINDGRGIELATSGNDLSIAPGDGGAAIEVALTGKKTLGDVIDAINTAAGSRAVASIAPGGNGITITGTGGGAVSATSINGSKAAEGLGLAGVSAAGAITGNDLLAGIDSVLLKTLKGGSGVALGTISIQSRAASSGASIDLSAAKSVADVINTINSANAGVKASLNSSGNGLQITDTSSGTGHLIIADTSGTGAASLGIAGDFDINHPTANGANLQRAWISANTALSSLNGGKGVAPGKFKLTTASGVTATIDLSQGDEVRLSNVISEINSRAIGVTASINANGDGLLLTDTTSGPGKLKVEDDGSTTAADLNIKGTATTTTLDGSFEKTIAVTATDTLGDVQKKINDLNFGVTAQVINDGSAGSPYRLSMTARNSGRAGRVVFDAGATALDTHNLVESQDAAVFVGSAGANQPLLVTASRNQLAGVVKGVNIDLHGVSDKPVQLNVTRSSENVSGEIEKFVDAFNEMVDKMAELTKWDTTTNKGGILLGEATVQTIQSTMYSSLQAVVTAGGKFRTVGDVGIGFDDAGKLKFDADKFNSAYGTDPQGVELLFTSFQAGVGAPTPLSQLNDGKGVRRNSDASQPDLAFTLNDGTSFNVALGTTTTVSDVLRAITEASSGKVSAAIGENNNLVITDTTTGTGSFKIQPAGISQAILDLGLNVAASAGKVTGKKLDLSATSAKKNAGLGVQIESAIAKLIDPASGVITRENKTLDNRSLGFQDRIKRIDSLLTQKRDRLEKQFSNMESVLSQLQGQQTSIGQIKSVAA